MRRAFALLWLGMFLICVCFTTNFIYSVPALALILDRNETGTFCTGKDKIKFETQQIAHERVHVGGRVNRVCVFVAE